MTQRLNDPNADACAIEVGGQTAGIAFSVADGVRFAASEALYWSVDGQTFESISAARRTLERLYCAQPVRRSRIGIRRAA